MKLINNRFVNILTPKNISVACKPSSVLCNHLSGAAVAYNFQRFFRASRTSYSSIRILHQVGFTSTISYHIVGKLLPYLSTLTEKTAVYFCCTFLKVAFTGNQPALCPMVLGLSSFFNAIARPPYAFQIILALDGLKVNVLDNI